MGWLKDDERKNEFSALASDLESFMNNSGRNPRCPLCRDEKTKRQLWSNPVRHGEEPMAMFVCVCEHCEARMTIFND